MRLRLAIAALGALLLAACEDTAAPPPPPDPPAPQVREDVLAQVERSYNDRNIVRYEKVLDSDFVFLLSDGDVHNGLPVQWDRATELSATTKLFSKSQTTLPLVKSIVLDVQFESGVAWAPVVPASAPAETWYTTTVFYSFQITVDAPGAGDVTLMPGVNASAQFTVRNTATEEEPRWQLVEMRDLGAGVLARRTLGTEQVTWGSVKALYR